MKMFFLENAPLTWTFMALAISLPCYAAIFYYAPERLYFWLWLVLIQLPAGFLSGLAVRNLLQQSSTDPLTGFYNRRFFYQQMQREMERFRRYGTPLSLAMIDLDDFKKVNDRFGHLAGDKVLGAVSEILKSSLRKTDIISRWGGEEFAVILCGTGPAEALEVAERLRKKIESTVLPETGLSLTISAGVASAGENMKPQELVLAADRAMYQAKKSKNKVVVLAAGEIEKPYMA